MNTLSISAIQTDIIWENPEANMLQIDALLKTIQNPTDVILLPEMFTTGFTTNVQKVAETMDGHTIKWMQQKAKETSAVMAGSIIMRNGNNFLNRFLWVEPNGKVAYYDKRHLFRIGNEHLTYTNGQNKTIVTYKNWKICLLVCYDLRFPVWSKNTIKPDGEFEYDIMIYVANWPDKRDYVWQTLLNARAIENQSYAIGVNRTGTDGNKVNHIGNSQIIDFKGNIIQTASTGNTDIIHAMLDKPALDSFRNYFQVSRDWDKFQIQL